MWSPARTFCRWLAMVVLLAGAGGTWAHDDAAHRADFQAPWSGPGWDGVEGGPPPINFPSFNVQLLAWLPVTEFNAAATTGNVAWGYVSPSGREYALMGFSHGTAFVEVTNPSSPEVLTVIAGPTSLWRDLKTYQTYCYAVSEGGMGIQIMDMADIDNGVVTLVGSVNTPNTSSTHTVAVNTDSGYLYRCGGGGFRGVRIYSLANPANPTWVATWNDTAAPNPPTGRYVHEAQVVTYTSGPLAGKEVAFFFSEEASNGGNAGINVVDVTNKSNMIRLDQFIYSNSAFSHQGWLSPDRQYMYLNDELDGLSLTRVFDMSDVTNVVELPGFNGGLPAIDHNLYTHGNLIFESNYRSGLHVFDATDPEAPVEVAWFDTYPENDNPNFNGLWSNYPYLPSGIVLGGDIEKGLFIWNVGPPLLEFNHPFGLPELLNPAGDVVRIEIVTPNGGELEPGSPKLHYNLGEGFVAVDLVHEGNDIYRGEFPASECTEVVQYYFSAASTTGVEIKDPMSAPNGTYSAVSAAYRFVQFEDDFESASSDTQWTVGAPGDDATTGIWERVNPVGTSAQPEDDHTADPGTFCFVTGQGEVGGGAGDDDVDNGQTTLLSPVFDLSGMSDANISYWRWYSNSSGGNPGEDVFVVDISDNGGASWTNVETIGPTGSGVVGGWIFSAFNVSDFVPPTSQVRLRFIASDEGSGSLIEAAIDDFRVVMYDCDQVPGDADGDVDVDLDDHVALVDCMDGPGVLPTPTPPGFLIGCLTAFDVDLDQDVDLADAAEFQAAFTGP